jgi:PiT family inorganic phosphate transporter
VFLTLLAVVVLSLIFDFINGFHDSANAIATVVSTRVLSPSQALLMAGALNFVGAFVSVHVANTIASGIVFEGAVTQVVVISAVLGAIVWNLITWYYGIPSSSSHALIGGLIGAAAISRGGFDVVKWGPLTTSVLIPIVGSPLMGLVVGYLLMLALLWMFRRSAPDRINRHFRNMQLVSSAMMAFSHGSNDAQKAMGIITLALSVPAAAAHWPWPSMLPHGGPPVWVIFACASAMALGTASGGWKIIHTMGSKILRLQPIHGFAAETSASIVLQTAAFYGMPVSTTHVIVASIMGVGATRRLSAVRWGVATSIVVAWVLTLPAAAAIAALTFKAVSLFLAPG